MQLTNRSKVVSNKEQSFMERLYLPAIAKGMLITASHLFKKTPTTKYPEQKRPMAPVYRGEHVLKRDENGAERCTACGLCAVACPAEAITMESAERKKGEEHLYREEKYAAVYEINMLRCIFCGLCEEACPKEAIFLTDRDNGDEDNLCDAILAHGITSDKVLIIGDSSGRFQNGRHDQGLVSFNMIKRRGFEITGPTKKKTPQATYPKNPDVEASLMRFRKWIAGGRYYVSSAPEASKMALAMKRCDAYADRYGSLKARGKWAHLVDCARYSQWWLSENLQTISGEIPGYVKTAGQRR